MCRRQIQGPFFYLWRIREPGRVLRSGVRSATFRTPGYALGADSAGRLSPVLRRLGQAFRRFDPCARDVPHRVLPQDSAQVEGGNPLLSGIIGDAWAGSVNIAPLEKRADVKRLGYAHGMEADSAQSKYAVDLSLFTNYWETHRDRLEDTRFRVVEAMRFKIVLLCYLRSVPEYFGFKWWSPFLDVDLAMAMLNLPPERKRDRVWQQEFFQKVGISLESMNLQAVYKGTLNLQALRRIPVKPLDVNLLEEVIKPHYVEWINRTLLNQSSGWAERFLSRLLHVRKVGGALRRLGFTDKESRQNEAYNAYLVLLPVEKLLRRRNQG